jgi:predicted DNA-binding protein
MEIHFKPETESRLNELASKSGRPTDELVEDAMAAYLIEVAAARNMLDSRYDEIKGGRVKPVDGETFSKTCAAAKRKPSCTEEPCSSGRAGLWPDPRILTFSCAP